MDLEALPKAELHVHIEGTLEPEMMFEMARRNDIRLRFADVDEVRSAYQFTDLQSFLDIYYEGAQVLQTEQDFYDLAAAYLRRAAADGVRRAEIFFDPQTHTARGIPFATVIRGLRRAIDDAVDLLSADLIMCFLRHLSPEEAMATFEEALPYRDQFIGVGLDSSERNRPPELFVDVYRRAAAEGLHLVAHAGEEGPPEYVWQALDLLGVERIDHGVRAVEDPALVDRLVQDQIPLTVCPLSNVKLRVFDRLEDHNLKTLLDKGVKVTINSDDPAYFGGYIGDNYRQTAAVLGLSESDILRIARFSLEATFLDPEAKGALLAELPQP